MKHIILLSIILCLASCQPDNNIRIIPEVADIEVSTKIIRFDQALMAIDTNDVAAGINELYNQYPVFTELYFKQLTGLYVEEQDSFFRNVGHFLRDKRIRKLQALINEAYADFSEIESDLIDCCKYLKHYFPEIESPGFYTLFSEFAFQSFIFSDAERDAVGIGLDMFLGEDFDYKNVDPTNPAFSEYLSRSYNKDHIVKKSLDILMEDIMGQPSGKRFIDQIIHKGKQLYIAQHILPEAPDTVIFEFSKNSWDWLNDNELEIWSFFLEKNILYETNHLKINKYINNSPNSPGMPPEAPGRTGPFIGYQIVKAFMNKKANMTLIDLIQFSDSQKLMEISKYKPNRR